MANKFKDLRNLTYVQLHSNETEIPIKYLINQRYDLIIVDEIISFRLPYETEKKLREHTEYKKRIAKELGNNIESTLKSFTPVNIDAKITGLFQYFNRLRILKIVKSLNIFSLILQLIFIAII